MKRPGGVFAKQHEKDQKQQFFILPHPINEKNFSIEFCPIDDCGLAQDVRSIRQEASCRDAYVFKTVSKMSYPIIISHAVSC